MTDLHIPPPLRTGRVHEAFGPSAATFAVVQALHADPAVIWIGPDWAGAGMFPDGMAPVLAPERVLLARTGSESDTLAVAEEALKDGSFPLVVIRTTKPLTLREGRRLQLAARAGGTTGLCLIPEGMGSNAAETRWHCAPVYDETGEADSTLMAWKLTKNKTGTLGVWHVRWNRKAHRLDVVSPPALGQGFAGLPE